MPPLDEGTLLFMPSTLPGISVTEAQRLLQVQDRILKRFPEVERVFGQGRPRRDVHRPGAVLDDGDRHRPEAARQWRKSTRGTRLGARVAEPCCATSRAITSRPTSWSPR